MVQTCYICKWRADRRPRRSFHKFPYDEGLRQKWLDIIGKSQVCLGKRTSVCSVHFEQSCFRDGSSQLQPGSVPSLQLTRPPEVDPYEELCNLHQVSTEMHTTDLQSNIEIKIEPLEPDEDRDYHRDGDTSPAHDSSNQPTNTENDATISNEGCRNEKLKSLTKYAISNKKKERKRIKQKPLKSMNSNGLNQKEFLKKQALVRMLVERLRRDHIRLKNYIQSLEEKQNRGKCRRRKRPLPPTLDT